MLRKSLLLAGALFLASCGGSTLAGPIAGSWATPPNPGLPGSGLEMTLLTSGPQVSGTGVAHVEAGTDQPFTVDGDATRLVFTFMSGAPSQTFAVSMPDTNHLQLTNGSQTELLVRK